VSRLCIFQIGRHGIRIEFVEDRDRHRTATYLPEVPSEQGGSTFSGGVVSYYKVC